MASIVKNVYAAAPLVIGSLRVAPLGTAKPTDAVVTPDVAYIDLGFIGDQGFTKKMDRRTTYKRAFGGKIVKSLQSEFTGSLQLRLLESLRADCLKAVYGANNVTVTPATSSHGAQVQVLVNSIKLPHMTWLLDTRDEELSAKYRIYIPDGQISTVGDVKVVHTDTIEYDITIMAFDDSSGNQMYVMTDDGQLSGS